MKSGAESLSPKLSAAYSSQRVIVMTASDQRPPADWK